MKTPKSFIILLITAFFIAGCGLKKNEYQNKTNKIPLPSNRYNVGILIMDGVFNTELTAPYDVFHHTIFRNDIKPMNVFSVANKSSTILTFEGMQIIPNFNYLKDSIPKIDILVIPSAEHHLDTDLEDQKMLVFVKKISEQAQFVVSHCDGAFVLAKSGVLDGYESTTFPSDIDAYEQMFPSLKVHRNVLFVHDGKFITSVGGAKSFEASLYLCELLYGKKITNEIAEGMVINWNLESLNYVKTNN